MMYDPVRDRLLLFGGSDGSSQTLNDIWELPLGVQPLTWNQGFPSGPQPAPRVYAGAIFDSTNDRVVIFGGALAVSDSGPPSNFVNDVWALPLNAAPDWTELVPSGTPPSARAGPNMIYDASRGRVVVYGGYDGSALGDAWSLSLSGSPQWTELTTGGGPPPPRAVAATTYDPPNDRIVIYGGISGTGETTLTDVWSLALGSLTWTALAPSGGPPSARNFPTCGYDLQDRKMIVYAGRGSGDGTIGDVAWALSLDGSPQWTELAAGPSGRYQGAGVYDPVRNRMILYGGYDGTNTFSDVWGLSTATQRWTRLTSSGSPPQRTGHSAIYDPESDRLLLFGGNRGTTDYSDVWAVSNLGGTLAWTQLAPSGGPPAARNGHSAVYDSRRDRMIIYGGTDASNQTFGDTWALDLAGNQWSQVDDGSSGPPARSQHVAVYDSLNDRMLIFSGWAQSDDLWALSLSGTPTWGQISAEGGPRPSARSGAAVGFDPVANAMLLFGGAYNGGGQANDTWILSLRGSPAWLPVDVGALTPRPRQQPAWAYDPAGARLIVAGGSDYGYRQFADTWLLSFDRTTPVLASLMSATAGPDGVELAWWLPQGAEQLRIERREPDVPWQAIASRDAAASGRFTYLDASVVAGRRYGYRLAIRDGGGEALTGEVWVDVPSGPRLELRGFVPNPARSEASLNFSLPDAAPARIEVLDVAARRVFEREVGSLGPGLHVVPLSRAALSPGLYIVRLVHGGRHEITRRAVLLR
jgi:hypothetical protein